MLRYVSGCRKRDLMAQIKKIEFFMLIKRYNCDRLRENRAQRGMRRRRKKIDLVLKIVLNKPNEGNG